MNNIQSIRHTVWDCKYHVVWIPKCRRKVLYGQLRQSLGEILRELVRQRESQVEEGHLRPDHVHLSACLRADTHRQACDAQAGMLVSIPPKYAVSEVVGYVKGKSAIYIARNFVSRRRNSCLRATHRQVEGEKFWARGYYVSTVGGDEAAIREYIKKQEEEDRRLDHLPAPRWARQAGMNLF